MRERGGMVSHEGPALYAVSPNEAEDRATLSRPVEGEITVRKPANYAEITARVQAAAAASGLRLRRY
ncbi:MAG: hypothetical protein OXP73_12150, partial [Chloroflexota bacterium]|nr:hypothetical protein [Chloroflexota bacterium]